MAQAALDHGSQPHLTSLPTLRTIYTAARPTPIGSEDEVPTAQGIEWQVGDQWRNHVEQRPWWKAAGANRTPELGSTGKGILIGMLSAFGSAALVGLIVAIVYFFRSDRGRILLDRISRPGEFDDEQQFLREEEEALAEMDDLQRAEYHRAKAFVQVNPPESAQTDISLSQFLAIQEKGVSAWEFEPELEIANCFVEARTEIEFFDSECSVQSNLPMPKQNEVYYWEAKLYDKPDTTLINIGLTTKPYPLFRMPGLHKTSIAYSSTGVRRYNQPFTPTPTYGPPFVQGDVIGIGYRPRTGTVFSTRNGKKLDDIAHGLKTQNFFPTVGANGPCRVHVNFGQMGFVFIEANVKKWGLAPMTGSLAPPPPYGSEAGSILLEGGREGVREGMGFFGGGAQGGHGHGRTNSAQVRLQGRPTRSPGPVRSPTDISLAQLNLMDSRFEEVEEEEEEEGDGAGEGGSGGVVPNSDETPPPSHDQDQQQGQSQGQLIDAGLPFEPHDHPPPEYESPEGSINHDHAHRGGNGDDDDDDDEEQGDADDDDTPRASEQEDQGRGDRQPLIPPRRGGGGGGGGSRGPDSPPIPTYEAATSATSAAEAARGRRVARQD
ncbi:Protein ssh4 [Recurvomyces mirabilis]|uniref:Protein ssh4 n=1 Tax=Recurvomyces mirabilis TaxID=574656 RepID=UPI002DE19DAF|nr:Protein ssh4 [Recurvomyces mirabilis]